MNIAPILPEITLFSGSIFILMLDVFLSKKIKNTFYISHLLSIILCALTILVLVKTFYFISDSKYFNNSFSVNSSTLFLKSISILLLTLVLMLSLSFVSKQKYSGELLALMIIATVGGMIILSANDFIVFYLGLELQALSLYLLSAFNVNCRKSSEAGIKYFILGSLASGILLFGISIIYGSSGTTNFSTINEFINSFEKNQIPILLIFGVLIFITAMFFKISAAPFHMWTPDVYQGSPSSVTTFFATVVKFTIVIALVKICSLFVWEIVGKVILYISIISIAVGSFGAIYQKNLKRLLAYSSISHVGFILLGLSGVSKDVMFSCILYMIIYSIISIGTFGFVSLIKNKDGSEDEKMFDISSLSGLSKTNPIMAFSLTILMFSTAGIPPLAGFFSKFYILISAISHGLSSTNHEIFYAAIIAIIFSVISAFYYIRIVKIIYFDEPKDLIELEDYGNCKLIILTMAIINLVFIIFINSIINLINSFII